MFSKYSQLYDSSIKYSVIYGYFNHSEKPESRYRYLIIIVTVVVMIIKKK